MSVIITNWNGKQYIKNCLDSLSVQTFTDFETILVDNGSNDGSTVYVREKFSWVRLVELPENLGFAEGNNRGQAVASGAFIVTLNNDTKIAPDFLAELVKEVQSSPKIGMVAAKIMNYYQQDRIDSLGIRQTTAGIGVNIGIGEIDQGQYDAMPDTFGPSAGAALYRREMLDETGFFDDDFFAYYEDLDLAWRGRLAGWQAATAPRAVAFHIHSATGGRMSSFTVYHVHRNKWYVLLKNWPVKLIFRHLPRIILYDVGALVLALLRGRIIPALRARIHVLRKLPLLLHKRTSVTRTQSHDCVNVNQLLHPGGSLLKTFVRKMGSGI